MDINNKPEVTVVLQVEGGPKVELKLGLWLRFKDLGWWGNHNIPVQQRQIIGFSFLDETYHVPGLHIVFKGNFPAHADKLYAAFVEGKISIAKFQMSDLELYAFNTDEDGLEGIEVIE